MTDEPTDRPTDETDPTAEPAADVQRASQALRVAVREIEAHAAAGGWDRPAQLFALVETADLLRREPQLAQVLGIEPGAGEDGLTPVEQESAVQDLEQLLPTILWPAEVTGAAVVLEASTQPPDPESGTGPVESEARVVAGVLRSGEQWCAIRQRAHDDDTMVLGGPDLVPTLLELLHATFVPDRELEDTDPEGPTESHDE